MVIGHATKLHFICTALMGNATSSSYRHDRLQTPPNLFVNTIIKMTSIMLSKTLFWSTIQRSPMVPISCTRNIWGWLNTVFNKVDQSRIKDVGPDLACAEWLLRCGAQVKWRGLENWQNDYNSLPRDKTQNVIEEIDGTDSSIMHIGFEHLRGLQHVKKIRLHKCHYLDDPAIPKLLYVQSSLEELHITSCGNVTHVGLMDLLDLKTLKHLELFDLPSVKDLDGCYQLLLKGLPNCQINYRIAKA